jgi:predicted nucleotidyltransferase component of viral defense system
MAISDNPILTEDQKNFLLRFRAAPFCDVFYLAGGTALSAFYLQHRLSEDLDFFTEGEVEIEEVLKFVRSLPDIAEVQYERKYDRRIFLLRDPDAKVMKVEFTKYPFTRLETGPIIEGIRLDSLRDILVNKLMAMTDRRDAKDYVDLYCALRKYPDLDLQKLVEQTELKFRIKGVHHILRGRFLEPLPPLGVLKMRAGLNQEELAQFFARQAKEWVTRSVQKL